MEALLQEIRHALRWLSSTPGFSIAGVLLLGVGIGAATAIFSVVDAVLFEPLVLDEDRVYVLYERKPADEVPFSEISLPHFFDWRERTTSFEDMAAFTPTHSRYGLELDGGEHIEVLAAQVTPSFFQMLGVQPFLGRGFLPEEDLPESDHAVVLSYEAWRQIFEADEEVLGRRIRLEQRDRAIVGVMPPGFEFPSGAKLWTPLRKEDPIWPSRGFSFLFAVGRLAPGVAVEAAAAELDALIPQLYRENDRAEAASRRVHAVPVLDYFLGDNTRSALRVLQGTVVMLLLIACANVSSLFLARGSLRRKEIAIRTALGASRRHVTRAILAETAVVALVGGGLGIFVAHTALESILALAPSGLPRLDQIGIDWPMLLFALSTAGAAAVLVAAGPAIGATRRSPAVAISDARGSVSTESVRLRQSFVFFEIAMTFVLVVASGLLIESFFNLKNTDLGYRTERLLLFDIKRPAGSYESVEESRSLIRRSIERVEGLSGVSRAGAVLVPPFAAGALGWDLWWVAESQNPPWDTVFRTHPETGEELDFSAPSLQFMEQNPRVNWEAISGGYFSAMAIPILSGRTFTGEDTENAPRVVIVSESFAEKLWPDRDPIGQHVITLGHRSENRRSEWQTVVGVVGDARYRELTGTRMDVYIPYQQSRFVPMALAVRAEGDPLAAATRVRLAIAEIDANLRVERVRTMQSVIDSELLPWRFNTTIVTVFALVALVLATLGVFGVVSQAVAGRAHEMGLRIALGASARDVLRLVLRRGMRPVLLGVAAGAGVAFSGARLQAHLYEIAPTDAAIYGVVTLVIVAAAGLASYLPARRASRLDPAVVLRSE